MDPKLQHDDHEEYDVDDNATAISSLTSYTWEVATRMPRLARQPDQETLSTFQPISSRPSFRPQVVLQSEPEQGTVLAETPSVHSLGGMPGAFSVRGIDCAAGIDEEDCGTLIPDQASKGEYGLDIYSEESDGLFLSTQSTSTMGDDPQNTCIVTIVAGELAPVEINHQLEQERQSQAIDELAVSPLDNEHIILSLRQNSVASVTIPQAADVDGDQDMNLTATQKAVAALKTNSVASVVISKTADVDVDENFKLAATQNVVAPVRKNSVASVTVSKTADDGNNENYKVLGIHRRCWVIILLVLLLLIAGGVATFIMLQDGSSSSNDNESSAPSAAPSALPTSLVTERWEFLLDEIGSIVMPSDAVEDGQTPADYFADSTSPQYEALAWMAKDDLEFDIFVPTRQELVERYVACVLYFSTDGATGWFDQLNFMRPGRSVCDWNNEQVEVDNSNLKGIFCVESAPIIRQIVLYNNGLMGPLPWELSLIQYLGYIDLEGNSMFGVLPIEWSSLSTLEILYVDWNALTGTLPPTWGETLTDLSGLNLERNRLSGTLPLEWSGMTMLKSLQLAYNDLSGTLHEDWSGMTMLNHLMLTGNSLNGTIPTEYGLLTSLVEFTSDNNTLTGTLPTEFGNLSELTNLRVSSNPLTGQVPTEFSMLTSLRQFWFNETNLTGSVDNIFCVPTPWVSDLVGDCKWESEFEGVPVNCSCCKFC
jgi:hypothetical protein